MFILHESNAALKPEHKAAYPTITVFPSCRGSMLSPLFSHNVIFQCFFDAVGCWLDDNLQGHQACKKSCHSSSQTFTFGTSQTWSKCGKMGQLNRPK